MAIVLPFASLNSNVAVQPFASHGIKKRPLTLRRHVNNTPQIPRDDVVAASKQTLGHSSIGHSGSSSNGKVPVDINPHELTLLKVVGRGTFACQVALAKHDKTQSLYVVKTLEKRSLRQRKQVEHTLTEKKVLEQLDGHPFIVKLYSAFQTAHDLHFVLEYCQGGELFFHLQQQDSHHFDEAATRFYAAEVLATLSELHARGIVYRDLKPENVLLDAQGHVKLTDFGFAKQDMKAGQRTYSFCGSPEYLSPEMVKKDGHGIETDMWSFGCFIYELLTGAPPFRCDNMLRLFRLIEQGRVWYPPFLSGHAMSLLKGLLCVNPVSRLTATQAMEHPFFKQSLDWNELLQRQVPPPIVPVCRGRESTENFDKDFTTAAVMSLKLQPSDLVNRLRRDDCLELVTGADEFQDF
uniref:AGC protein kinase n=1 Tax=Peronospora matthiolae TaxID=2874970 RepID=A0AAV1TUB5_9STRA